MLIDETSVWNYKKMAVVRNVNRICILRETWLLAFFCERKAAFRFIHDAWKGQLLIRETVSKRGIEDALCTDPECNTFFSCTSSRWYFISSIAWQLTEASSPLKKQLFIHEKLGQVFSRQGSLKYANRKQNTCLIFSIYRYIHVQITDEKNKFNTCSGLKISILWKKYDICSSWSLV